MKDLVEWLSGVENRMYTIKDVKLVSVQIGRTTYKGAMYTRMYNHAVEGELSLYLLSDSLPPSYKRNPGSMTTPGIHYRDQNGIEWLLSGYMVQGEPDSFFYAVRPNQTGEEALAEFHRYHPFGTHFDLAQAFWIEEGTKFMNITIQEVN